MLTSKQIKEIALAAGADACGIAPMSRFNGAPDEMNPQFLFPEAKSCIGFVFRIPRGVQRGIEEGTQFYQYPSMAYGGINEIFAPAVLYQVGKYIEDEGYEAFVYRNTGARGVVSDMDGSPGNTLSPEEQIEINENAKTSTAHHRSVQFTRPTRENNVAPDLQFQFRLAAVVCGLGEMGLNGKIIAKNHGPYMRYAFIITDAPLDTDEPLTETLCDKCGACITACPGNAISEKGLDTWQCGVYYKGAHKSNPFMTDEFLKDHPERDAILNGEKRFDAESAREIYKEMKFLPNTQSGYAPCLCGKKCDIACYNHLKEIGKI